MIIRLRKTILVTTLIFLALGFPVANRSQKTPPQPKVMVTFASGNSALRIPIEINNNLILIEASLNGKRPLKLIFDTGASATGFNADLEDELGIKGTEKFSGTATGGPIEVTVARGIRIAVKGVEVSEQPVGILALPRIPGFHFDGVMGFDFISEFVVEIDYLNKVMSLYDPKSYRYRGKGTIVPFRIKGRQTPLMDVSFLFRQGRRATATLELDTGADSAFVLNNPFVEKHRLLKTSKNIETSAGRGAGGETERILGEATRVSVGPFVFNKVPVFFSLQKEGVDTDFDGVVGGEVLRRFKVIIDYSRSRIILEPNKDLKGPFEVDG